MKTALFAALFVAVLSVSPLRADSWMPFPDQRVVSADGRHYAILREVKGKGVTFEIHERAAGRPPLESAGAVVAEPGDALKGSGVLPHAPLEAFVPNGGGGLVLFEVYAAIGSGNSATVIDREGRVRAAARLEDLFDAATISNFQRTISSIWWHQGAFLADEKALVVLVARGDLLRAVRFDGGVETAPAPEVLLDGIRSGKDAARRLALDVASRLKPAGLAPAAKSVLADTSAPLATRARAAVALAATGDPSGASVVLEAAKKGAPKDAREYALARLADFVPAEEAIAHFREAMRGKADDGWNAAQAGFVALGDKSVPVLKEMLRETAETPDYRGGAAHALGKIGSEEAIDDLLATIADESEYVANAACNAAILIGGPKLLPGIVRHLERGTTQDARMAYYLQENADAAAVPALVAALRRHLASPMRVKRAIVAALEECAPGIRAGYDADAWEKALGEK